VTDAVRSLRGLSHPPLPIDAGVDGAFSRVLEDLVQTGERVATGPSESIGSLRPTRELLNSSFVLTNPRRRLLANKVRRFNVMTAVARFIWMMSASERLDEIEPYEPRVGYFSDNGRTVPGSNTGKRIFRARPDVDQLGAVIRLLREDPATRRAAVAIYHPEDAGRRSRDIPCAFGMFFMMRGGRLNATAVMRSNNAWGLLPYNVFEFTLLAEIVASELGVDVGEYHHFAGSMHIYETDFDRVSAALKVRRNPTPEMAVAPLYSLEKVNELVAFEADARGRHTLTMSDIDELMARASVLGPYWQDFALVLLCHQRYTGHGHAAFPRIVAQLSPPFRTLVEAGPRRARQV
jgi:hypothetical protein